MFPEDLFELKGIGDGKLLKTYVNKLFYDSLYQDRCFVNLKSIINAFIL